MPLNLIHNHVNKTTPDGDWAFGYVTDPIIRDVGSCEISKEVVLGIYREVVGQEPSTGLDVQQILDNWDRLEPRLAAEVAQRVRAA